MIIILLFVCEGRAESIDTPINFQSSESENELVLVKSYCVWLQKYIPRYRMATVQPSEDQDKDIASVKQEFKAKRQTVEKIYLVLRGQTLPSPLDCQAFNNAVLIYNANAKR